MKKNNSSLVLPSADEHPDLREATIDVLAATKMIDDMIRQQCQIIKADTDGLDLPDDLVDDLATEIVFNENQRLIVTLRCAYRMFGIISAN